MAPPIIAIATDFGWGSSYVAQLKGVLLSRLPTAQLVDVSHSIPAQSLRHAEILLRGTAFAFPLGTVHLVVTDPGVGSSRRPLAGTARGMTFVGPDNGVLAGPLSQEQARCVHLGRPEFFRESVSPTFHGRDLFAPVAAELAAGVPLTALGEPAGPIVESSLPGFRADGAFIWGQTLAADSFGNLLTNVPGHRVEFRQPLTLWHAGTSMAVRWVRTYADAPPGLVALVGSDGFVELAQAQGSAHAMLGTDFGLEVRVTMKEAQ